MPQGGATPDETPARVDHEDRRYNGLRICHWDLGYFPSERRVTTVKRGVFRKSLRKCWATTVARRSKRLPLFMPSGASGHFSYVNLARTILDPRVSMRGW
jgi:hypothetical protein